jgi:hypothetical protein
MEGRRYANPQAFKQALEQRLKSEAQRTSVDLRRLRQFVVYERFLARAVGEFQDAVVLKGGIALELRLRTARATKDVDLRMTGRPEETLARLEEAGRRPADDFFSYFIVPDPDRPELEADGMQYEGYRFRVEARLAGQRYGDPFGLDIAFAEPLHGEPELIAGRNVLSFAGIEAPRLLVYPTATHIAEKLHAYTLPRPRPNSRVKDLPDLALLGTLYPFEAVSLRSAIEGTFHHRATHPAPSALPTPPPEWSERYSYLATENKLPWATITLLMTAVETFLNPVLSGRDGRWDPQGWRWVEG